MIVILNSSIITFGNHSPIVTSRCGVGFHGNDI
jgi:hypothetical protein